METETEEAYTHTHRGRETLACCCLLLLAAARPQVGDYKAPAVGAIRFLSSFKPIGKLLLLLLPLLLLLRLLYAAAIAAAGAAAAALLPAGCLGFFTAHGSLRPLAAADVAAAVVAAAVIAVAAATVYGRLLLVCIPSVAAM